MKRLQINYVIFALWLAIVGASFVLLAVYKGTPGIPTSPGPHWPSDSVLERDLDRPTLVFFAHPNCACTRASVEELKTSLANAENAMAVMILYCEPSDAAESWSHDDIRNAAECIRNARVVFDVNGVEARRFSATTSGHTFVYAADGRLLFSGGVTGARGHLGVNPGGNAVAALAKGKLAIARTPVFGCPLYDPSSQPK